MVSKISDNIQAAPLLGDSEKRAVMHTPFDIIKEKTLTIELSHENPLGDGYFYAMLDLPAEEHEIRDAIQRARMIGREESFRSIGILDCGAWPELLYYRLDSPTIDELNFFANRIAQMDDSELAIFRTVAPKVLGSPADEILSTSIGANIREAFYAHGKADFIAKLQIALKECSESEYWIELLLESGYYGDKSILEKCTELKRICVFIHIPSIKNSCVEFLDKMKSAFC